MNIASSRFYFLLSTINWKRILRWLLAILLAFIIVVLALAVYLRYWLFPNIDQYRPKIEHYLSESVGRKITLDKIEAEWAGILPSASIFGVTVYNDAGERALMLDKVDMALSLTSITRWRLIFDQLSIYSPTVMVSRVSPTVFFVGGFKVDTEESSNPAVKTWFFVQKEILVQNTRVIWTDDTKEFPDMDIAGIDLVFENTWRLHKFAIHHTKPTPYFNAIDLRGDFRGRAKDEPLTWRGRLYCSVEALNLDSMRRWVKYPIDMTQGMLTGECWASIRDGQLIAFETKSELTDGQIHPVNQATPLDIRKLSTQFSWKLTSDYQKINIPHFYLETKDKRIINPEFLNIAWREPIRGESGVAGQVVTKNLDVGALASMAHYFPLPSKAESWLAGLRPRGVIDSIDVKWKLPEEKAVQADNAQGSTRKPVVPPDFAFSVIGKFSQLSLASYENIPGFSNASVSVKGTQKQGKIDLAVNNGHVTFPGVFAKPDIALSAMSLGAKWVLADDRLTVDFSNVAIKNSDLSARVSGNYQVLLGAGDLGNLDLKASVASIGVATVPGYLPEAIGQNVLGWLKESLKGGTVRNIVGVVKGPLAAFPFPKGEQGIFDVRFDIVNGHLRFLPEWDPLEQLDASVRFYGTSMEIDAKRALLEKQVVASAKVNINDFDQPVLLVDGKARGPAHYAIQYVKHSPLTESPESFLGKSDIAGNVELALKLSIPLSGSEKPKVQGEVMLTQAEALLSGLPAIHGVSGTAKFSERGLDTIEIKGQALEGDVLAVGKREKDAMRIRLRGQASAKALGEWAGFNLSSDMISGKTSWGGSIGLYDNGQVTLAISSKLQGIVSKLPVPLSKTASEEVALKVDRMPIVSEEKKETRYRWRVSLGEQVAGQFHEDLTTGNIITGKLFVGIDSMSLLERSPFPARGFRIGGRIESFNIDDWLLFWPLISSALPKGGSNSEHTNSLAVNVGIKKLTGYHRTFENLILRTHFDGGRLALNFQSEAIDGNLSWSPEGHGTFIGRFERFYVPKADRPETAVPQLIIPQSKKPVESLPTLDISVKNFHFEGQNLGQLRLLASNTKTLWKVQKLSITNSGGTVTLTGQWDGDSTLTANTSIELNAEIKRIEKLLPIFGLQDQITGGAGEITGQFFWVGLPFAPKLDTISGEINFDLSNGAIVKAHPGLFGKLLGLVSLQSIGRRLSLNFGDVTGSGFAFDSIQGSVKAEKGIFRIQDSIMMVGPAAGVRLRGKADVAKNEVDMNLRITPSLSESVAIISSVVGTPILALITYAAQKVLQNPVDQIMRIEYSIRGSLSDPELIERVSVLNEEAQEEHY